VEERWLDNFGDTPEEQIELLREMLEHADEDGMDPQDKTQCLVALQALERKVYGKVKTRPMRAPMRTLGKQTKDHKIRRLVPALIRATGVTRSQAIMVLCRMTPEERAGFGRALYLSLHAKGGSLKNNELT
jgi:hypothetical protein